MKLILSRKGFDSASGGGPSPIFPDGTTFSLPIPSGDDNITYGELRHVSGSLGEVNIGRVVTDLTRRRRPENRIGTDHRAHLDPDINFHVYPRQEGWKGLFGQGGGTETHLADEGVDAGDLFLFFGLFREVQDRDGCWRFIPGSPPLHVLWGWLQIGEVHEQVGRTGLPELPWASHHPHLQYIGDRNTIYVASESLKIGNRFKTRGEGVFPQLRDELVLTEPGRSVSHWKLPRWFYPEMGKPALTYHDPNRTKSNRWTRRRGDGEHVYLQSVGRGQEFVLDCDHYPEAIPWARGLIRDLGAK